MKNIIYLFSTFLLTSIFLTACGEYNSEQQQLWDEVMVVHDEVMPKMGELHKLEKQLKKQTSTEAQQAAITKIEAAQESMMDWMRNFKPMRKVAKMEHQVAMDYLKEEQKKVAEVKRLMLEGIEVGQGLLSEKE
ncbi:MAG: hypothetical protein AAF960_03215 [Bacteroidota bacterium]